MTNYRAYVVGENGSFASSVQIQEDSDVLALERANALFEDKDVEVWEGVRFVARLDAERKTAAAPPSLPASEPLSDQELSNEDVDEGVIDPEIFADVDDPDAVYDIPEASVGMAEIPPSPATLPPG